MPDNVNSGAGVDPVALADAVGRGSAQRARTKFYDAKFDLTGLPDYRPSRDVWTSIRQCGNHYFRISGLMEIWESGFRRHHPQARFDDNLASSAVAFGGLIAGTADLATMGRAATWTELKGAERQNASANGESTTPLEVTACTGSYDVAGWTFALGVFVHASNPLSTLTLDQLDGIFGAERSGGWRGLEWEAGRARGAEGNIRTWGQLGLAGEWADRPINVYGYNLHFHFPDEFDKKVLKGSYKWNERLVMYANGINADGTLKSAGEQIMADLSNDPYGIAYTGIKYLTDQTKAVALAASADGPYVELTLQNVQNRTYPLTRDVYYYATVRNGRIDPNAGEFLRYIVSREAQEAIQEHDGKYLPLTADAAAEQLRKIEKHMAVE